MILVYKGLVSARHQGPNILPQTATLPPYPKDCKKQRFYFCFINGEWSLKLARGGFLRAYSKLFRVIIVFIYCQRRIWIECNFRTNADLK